MRHFFLGYLSFASTPSTPTNALSATKEIDDDWVDLVTKKNLPIEKEWVYVSENGPQANLITPKGQQVYPKSSDPSSIEKEVQVPKKMVEGQKTVLTETSQPICIVVDNKHQNPKDGKANASKKHKPSRTPTTNNHNNNNNKLSVNAVSPRKALELLLFDHDSKSKSSQPPVFELKENGYKREKRHNPKLMRNSSTAIKVPRVRESKALKQHKQQPSQRK